MGIEILKENKIWIVNDFYDKDDEMEKLNEYPKISSLLEDLEMLIESNKGRRKEMEKLYRKYMIEEKENVLNQYK